MGEFFKCDRSFVGEGVRVDELDTDLDCVFEEFGYCKFSLSHGGTNNTFIYRFPKQEGRLS